MLSCSCLQPESLVISTVAVSHTCCHSECRRSNTGGCSAVWSFRSQKQEWTNYDNQIKSNKYIYTGVALSLSDLRRFTHNMSCFASVV